MLTRRHIRVKVMQSIYALSKSQSQNLDTEIKFLQKSIGNSYHLYLLLMSLLKELHKTALKQIELSKTKYLKTEADKNPNRKFIDNQLLKTIAQNQLLDQAIDDVKMNRWDLDSEYITIIFGKIIESDIYQSYMNNPKSDFKTDQYFLTQIFKECIAPDEKLYEYIEDANLTWIDDLPIVNTFIVKLFKKATATSPESYFLPKLFKDEDDKLFADELLKKTVLNDEKWQQYIDDKTPNWDKERIASLDNIILKMAVCELLRFASIPVKVTFNEYLEIAKEYSTEKSSIFINGVLDKLVRELKEKNELNKVGRGLL